MATMQPGTRVQIKKIMFAESEQHNQYYNHLVGQLGWLIKTDGHMFEVLLDKFASDGYKVFFEEEIQEVLSKEDKGGDMPMLQQGVTFRNVLQRKDMSAYEKLVYVVVHEFAPVDYATICDCLGIEISTATHIVDKLKDKGMITSGVGNANLFWPAFTIQIGKQMPDTKNEGKKEKETSSGTSVMDREKDVLLFVKMLERYYKKRGVSFHVSRKGKKYIAKAIDYLNKLHKDIDKHPELMEFEALEDLYYCYIEYVFKNLVDNELNHLKRLTFAGSKGGWRAWMKNSLHKFDPYLIPKSFSDRMYYGIPKSEIPANPTDSGYHSTLQAFLFSKWEQGNYPLSPQVLYALESYIIYKLFRKQEIGELKDMHRKYLEKYKLAEARDRLDNLQEYVNKNKKRSDYCHDCAKKRDCTLHTKSAIVELCSEKV